MALNVLKFSEVKTNIFGPGGACESPYIILCAIKPYEAHCKTPGCYNGVSLNWINRLNRQLNLAEAIIESQVFSVF